MSDWTRRSFVVASAIGGLAASGRRLFGAAPWRNAGRDISAAMMAPAKRRG